MTEPTPEQTERALAAAWVHHVPTLQTEALSLTELAMYWNVNRNKMGAIVRAMPGAEQCGKKWRLPVVRMPVDYLTEKGLARPGDFN